MGTFIKTFIICLFATLALLCYKNFLTDSYSTDLNVSKVNPIFGVHEGLNEPESTKPNTQSQKNTNSEKPVTYTHKCYFYSHDGKLTLVERNVTLKPTLRNALLILLKGPTIKEAQAGMFSEIPMNVDLISTYTTDKGIVVDLTDNFGLGGGTQSVENRVKQLAKTVKLIEPNKDIYLYINGSEVEYLGGEGVYIKQPLE